MNNDPLKRGAVSDGRPTPGSLEKLRAAALNPAYVSLGTRRTETAHEFYRYPARFPPSFAEEAIATFTAPGDVVLDPYVGGGTTVVAAQMLRRRSVGTDINPLATFVTRVKTTRLTMSEISELRVWAEDAEKHLRLVGHVELPSDWEKAGYLRNLNTKDVWRIRNTIALALSRCSALSNERTKDLARCAILRTGQWALDMTVRAPTVAQFRDALRSNLDGMLDVVGAETPADIATTVRTQTVGLPGLKDSGVFDNWERPKLILTSPPYPGVYVLYHRWKVLGRRESPAPYWIAAELDGHGMAHYTMGDRLEEGLDTYFKVVRTGFLELVELADPAAWIVQMIGFKNVDRDLPRYLGALNDAGLTEVQLPQLATARDGRLWREVPNRRWWTQNTRGQSQGGHTSREVVLFHRMTEDLKTLSAHGLGKVFQL